MNNFTKIFLAAILMFQIAHCLLLIDNCKAQWVQTSGPKSATVTCFASSGSNIFAGTEGGGVFYSDDNGTSWTNISSGLYSLDILSLLVKDNYIFAGTNSGIYISTNNGLDWSAGGFSLQGVVSMAISETNLFAAVNNSSYSAIYRSSNNGVNWNSLNYGNPYTSFLYTLFVSESNIYVGSNQGIYMSVNNGSNWTSIGPTSNTVNSISKIGEYLYAGTNGSGVFRTSNNGANWATYSFGLLNPYVSDFEIIGNDLFAGTDGGVFRLVYGGTMWDEMNTGLTHYNVRSILFKEDDLFAGTEGGGVFHSEDHGAFWIPANSGLMYEYLSVGAITSNNVKIYSGTGEGVYLSTNNGSNWTAVNSGLSSISIISLAISGSTIFAGTSNYMSEGGLFISTNNGANWSLAGFPNLSIGILEVSGSNIYAFVGDSGIFHSSNNGSSWNFISIGLPNVSLQSIAVSYPDIFVGTYGEGIFYSNNNGLNWSAVNSGLSSTVIFALAINGSTVFAGTYGGGVFRSTNLGANWYLTGLTGIMVTDIVIKGDNVFVSSYGVHRSTDNGISWDLINQGFPGQNLVVNDLALTQTDLIAGLYNYGIWRRPISEIISVKNISTEIPNQYSLSQNYPNPFNPNTIINYELRITSYANLVVLDIMGREITTLVNEKQSPGAYQAVFDGRGLPSGVYFYRLTAGEFTDTKRMMLLK